MLYKVMFSARFTEEDMGYILRDMEEFDIKSSIEDKGFEVWAHGVTLYIRGISIPAYELDNHIGLSLWDWDTMVKPLEVCIDLYRPE